MEVYIKSHRDLETYQECYIDALEICDNEEAEKLMYWWRNLDLAIKACIHSKN